MSDRLPPMAGEWIDRTQSILFTFEGQRYWGYAGDTITSALWASGQRVLGRSFKYHRPRGILSFANHDINTLMQSGQDLNLRADVTALVPNLNLTAVNTVGGLESDRAQVLDLLSAFLPVGFYYKAFHHKALFPHWEHLIRRLTGLGRVDITTPRQTTTKRYDFCDVLVIGAGISGLSAAFTAAEAGANVVIVEENAHVGGTGLYQRGGGSETPQVLDWIARVTHHPRIRIYTQTYAAGYYADHWVPLVHASYISKMRAKAVIVATGAYEQPAVFHNNDRPGVMLASAAQRLIYHYAVRPMRRGIVLTSNQDGYRAALDLVQHGVEVIAIIDMRSQPSFNVWVSQVRSHHIPIFQGFCIYEARSNPSRDGISAAVICPLNDQGLPDIGFRQVISCDSIVMSVGWAPASHLLYQAGTTFKFAPHIQQFVPDVLPPGIFACGRVQGIFEFEQKELDGDRAGQEAAEILGLSSVSTSFQATASECPSHPYPIVPHPQGKNFVDFDEDLQLKDFCHAAQEGFDSIELLKRYTTVGMGPSQGKHSNMNALRILAKIHGKSPDEIGTTTARPMVHPVPMAHLAGRGFIPERRTPLHDRHVQRNAIFLWTGNWQRPAYYATPGLSPEMCIQQEAIAVHSSVGLIDVGTLGKLELRGKDAALFLERIYTGKFAGMKVGTTRYALMVDEAGVILDDGVVARLAPDHFYFTTTTSGSTRIYRELSRLNTLWNLDCGLVNLTGARAAINVAGPSSRIVLSRLTDLNLSPDVFPYLAAREAIVAGVPAVILRVGFVGEWGYEIHVPSEFALGLWDALIEAGSGEGIRPFGVEAQRLLRLEKGHLIVGQDTDGLTTPWEAGCSWAVKLDKPFFMGQRSLQILQQRSPKQQLVGFCLASNFTGSPPQECHLIIHHNDIAGRITSIGYSPMLQRYVGLAYVSPTLTAIGTTLSIRHSDGTLVTAVVCSTPFYDPENLCQKDDVLAIQERMS